MEQRGYVDYCIEEVISLYGLYLRCQEFTKQNGTQAVDTQGKKENALSAEWSAKEQAIKYYDNLDGLMMTGTYIHFSSC